MPESSSDIDRPIRVVLFGGGPGLEWGVRRFLSQLEDHSEIELLGGFFQSEGDGFLVTLRDLWRRRGILAAPLLFQNGLVRLIRFLSRPGEVIEIHKKMDRISERLVFIPDIHAEEVLEAVKSLKPDLGLIYGSPILKPALFELPRLGTLGIHHGKVPQYRGKKTTFWAIYQGEETAGVTIQKINAGLDTGEIVLEGEVPIGRRSLGAVWDDLESLGISLYIQAILAMKQRTATVRSQVGNKGKLYRDPKMKDVVTFWFLWLKRLRFH